MRRAVCLLFFSLSLSLPLFDFVFLVVYILHTLLDLHVLHLCYTHTLCYGIRIVRSLSRSLARLRLCFYLFYVLFFLSAAAATLLVLLLLPLLLLNFVGSWQGATEKNKTKISTARALPTDTTTTRHVTRSLSSTLLCAREQRQGKIGKSTTKTTTAATATAAAADCGSGSVAQTGVGTVTETAQRRCYAALRSLLACCGCDRPAACTHTHTHM